MDIREMEAGRELDALVAEKVMNLDILLRGCVEEEEYDQCLFDWDTDVPCPCPYMLDHGTNEGCEHYQPIIKPYSTNISAAWEVVEKLCIFTQLKFFSDGWHCGFGDTKSIRAETAPEAICKAALLAMEDKT